MSPSIPGFRITHELQRSTRTAVYRAIRDADRLPVLLKTVSEEVPAALAQSILKREHELLDGMEVGLAVRPLGLVPSGTSLAIVFEDSGAQPLSSLVSPGQPMPLEDFFPLAIACARALDSLHQRFLHRDLHPGNILWDSERQTLRLFGFCLASELGNPGEPPHALAGSLAFMAPELSGRLSHEPDARSDLYSLGVTFYSLLAGEPPFKASDPLEWVYSHVAQLPAPPQRLNRTLPDALGDLVLKLMAKNPSERYQSAKGLLNDLLEGQRQWRETGTITPFPLARAEVRDSFQLHPRLLGRDQEAQALHAAFDAARNGKTVLVTLAGPAGSGKTTLVHDVMRQATASCGLFLAGKFDQYQRQAPYAALSEALGRLVRHLLTEPEERLATWKADLLLALGQNGHIALELVPDLVHVIGPQPPLETLNPTEEQNRFLSTIDRLVATLASPEQPVVLFLDDLQWSDTPTILLLRRWLETQGDLALLLIVAFRNEELSAELTDLLDVPGVRHMPLRPLDEDAINRLVADALQTDPTETRSLGSFLFARTDGNPFFAKELLRTLHQDGLVFFDDREARWTWEVDALPRARMREDVVEFMLGRIRRLEPETQALLSLAAAIGRAFDLRLLAQAWGRSPADLVNALWPAFIAGLVLPRNEDASCPGAKDEPKSLSHATRCEFLHDRVRQAAYALLPDEERRSLHLRIGRLMLAQADEEELRVHGQEIALQLNAGRALMIDDRERLELARLNLQAARKAKESAAYRPAFEFVEVAREVLPDSTWSDHPELALEIFRLSVACAHLCGEFEVAERCCVELMRRSRTPIERAEVHALTSSLYSFSNRMDEAIGEGLKALGLLGIKLSAQPGAASVAKELALTKAVQGRRTARDFEAAPLVTDPRIRLTMRILADFMAPAYLTGNETLFATTMLRLARLSLRHGNCVEAVTAYSCYSVMLAGLGDFTGAYEFGELALRLTERFGAYHTKSRTLVLYALFAHSWSAPWEGLDAWFKESVDVGRRSGDFLFMAFACGYVHFWAPQADLGAAVTAGEHYLAICRQSHYQNALNAALCAQQLWRSLRGETHSPLSLSDARFDEGHCLEQMQEARYVSGLSIYHLCKLQLACLHEQWEVAWSELLAAKRTIKALAGSPYVVDLAVHGFRVAARMAARGGAERAAAWRLLRGFHRQMKAWTRHCPANFQSHLSLMEAELAWLEGRLTEAPILFERAVMQAKDRGFVRYEALANEAAARFYQAQGLNKAAHAYLQDAREAYSRWGAIAKVRSLEHQAPGDVSEVPALEPTGEQPVHLGLVPQLVANGVLDLSTVWKATQAISGEVILRRLLERLLSIVKENAGAQSGVLILAQESEGGTSYVVQAESTVDGTVTLLQGKTLEEHGGLPSSLVRYVIRTRSVVVLGDAAHHGGFTRDPYVQAHHPKSILALPVINQGALLGVLYLENNLLTDAFSSDRMAVLQILSAQAGISLQNALAAEKAAYMEANQQIREAQARELESRVEERTAELRQAYDQLMELDQLKTSFLSLVSHELRTPLTTILGYAEFLEDRLDGDLTNGQEESVRQIQQATLSLKRLVDDLLDFARMESGTFSLVRVPFDLGQKITEVVESLRPIVREHALSVRTLLPDAPVRLSADPDRLGQVLINLIGNAVKFTPAGGTITVSLQATASAVRVEVVDTGIGIESEHHEKLFQRFYQVDATSTREKGGAGLGLSICQSIVEAHGGRIGVHSVPEAGSTFWIELPLDHASPRPEADDGSAATER